MKNDDVPVFVYRQGNPYFLEACLLSARKYNETVYLAGDFVNKKYKNIFWVDINDLVSLEYQQFINIYSKKNNFSIENDVAYFKRHFSCLEFMKKYHYEKCFFVASDVLSSVLKGKNNSHK